ncbi:MAG: NAD(P)/FAD-dependent oxidoreductase [Nitrososphaerales archaeon]
MNATTSIVGGSVSGLIAAEVIAKEGLDVSVFEEHREIGVPEKCDGLVSSRGIADLGITPPSNVIQNSLSKAIFFSPSGQEIAIDAGKQKVIVMDRARFDKHLAERAARAGAKIYVGKRILEISQDTVYASAKIDSEIIKSNFLLDCSGYESYIRSGGVTLQGGQYLAYGKWFEKSTVEVYIDPKIAPGFFYWVIPISSDMAKIGVAGTGINTFETIDEFARKRGAMPIRKMAAPVVCSGVLKKFVENRIARVGDAAGQAKPTTGGGIYTGGYGGLLAGRAVVRAVCEGSANELQQYEQGWREKFGNEFRIQYYARRIFGKMTGEQIDHLFETIKTSDVPRLISEEGDFDMHSIAIAKAFGFSKSLSAVGMALSNEIKNLFN